LQFSSGLKINPTKKEPRGALPIAVALSAQKK
jgi:hypothetical protein